MAGPAAYGPAVEQTLSTMDNTEDFLLDTDWIPLNWEAEVLEREGFLAIESRWPHSDHYPVGTVLQYGLN